MENLCLYVITVWNPTVEMLLFSAEQDFCRARVKERVKGGERYFQERVIAPDNLRFLASSNGSERETRFHMGNKLVQLADFTEWKKCVRKSFALSLSQDKGIRASKRELDMYGY